MAVSALLWQPGPAAALPRDCRIERVDHDTFYAKCTQQRQWRLRVDCDRWERDKTSAWRKAGQSASEGCTWGNARGATIETR